MSDETKAPETPEEPQVVEPEAPKPPQAEWRYKSEFGIITHMRTIINETIKVARMDIDRQRKKLKKLTYGA